MARKLGAFVDFDKNEARNLRFHILSGAPSSPVLGQVYTNSTDFNTYVWNGTTWDDITMQGTTAPDADATTKGIVQLAGDLAGTAASPQIATGVIVNTDINAGAAIALTKLATDPLARANHTGTQLASTVSNFDTQVRTSRLDQMAAPTAAVAFNAQKITGLATGTAGTDAANVAQLQAAIQGIRWLGARVASTANLTLSGTQTIDGVAVGVGDYVLAKNQTTTSQNGPYVVAAGAWTRAPEMDTAAEVDGRAVIIEDGTQAGTMWVTTSDVTTLDTDAIVFTQFNSAADIVAGLGLSRTGNTIDVNVDASSIEINADTLRVKAAGITNAMLAGAIDLTTKVTGALPLGNGGTGQTTAKTARETGLVAAGYFSSATHGAVGVGGTIVISQATHGLRASKGIQVQTQDEATGDLRLDDANVAASGDVTITYAAAQGANSIRVTLVG